MTERCIICDWPTEPRHCELPDHCCYVSDMPHDKAKAKHRRDQFEAAVSILDDKLTAARVLRAILDAEQKGPG